MHDQQLETPRAERSSREPASAGRDGSAHFSGGRSIPVVAIVLACAYLAAALGAPSLIALVVVAATLGGAALARAYRPPRFLVRTIVLLATWLALGFVGAWWLRDRPLGGLAWVLIVIYLVPLPLIPTIHAFTFRDDDPPTSPTSHDAAPPSRPATRRPEPGFGFVP